MTNKIFATLLLSAITFAGKAQTSISTDSVDSLIIVKGSISNLKNMLQMSFEDWENTLIKMGYSSKSISIDNVNGTTTHLSKDSKTDGNVHSITKSASIISIDWYHPGNSTSVFKYLLEQLKPYYKGIYGGNPAYQIKEGSTVYQYLTMKYENGETIILKRK